MTNPANPPITNEELIEHAREVDALLSGPGLLQYFLALEEFLDTSLPVPGILSPDGKRMPLDQAPADIQAYIRERFLKSGNQNDVVSSLMALMEEAHVCTQAFLEKRPGYGLMDTAGRFAQLGRALRGNLIDKIPRYERMQDEWSEKRWEAAEAANGSKLTTAEGMALHRADPLYFFSAVSDRIEGFAILAQLKQEQDKGGPGQGL